jgi:hypothetical protein
MALGDSLVQTASSATNLISAVSGASDIGSALRSGNLPAAGEAIGNIVSAVSSFSSSVNPADWRVQLSLSSWTSFAGSPVLKPLKDAGGLIFPYTPTINLSSNATYNKIDTTHTNYTFQAFKNTEPGSISISAPFNVEDATQGLYWIAAVHYLRSLTKMFSGTDALAGNPPPVIFLNGYGNYVFKNVPVVVTSFGTSLDANCDYIGVNVVGSLSGAIGGAASAIGSLSDSLGSAIPGIGDITSTVSSIASSVSSVASLASSLGITGTTSGGVSHVPTKSTLSITLQPVYSRNSAKNFSLDTFVTGGYLNNSFGYI